MTTRPENDFWGDTSYRHERWIKMCGMETFKRNINFEYGQMAVFGMRDPKIKRIAWSLLKIGRLPVWGFNTHYDHHDTNGIRCRGWEFPGNEELDAYAFYCGLLYQYAKAVDPLWCLQLREPNLGSPLPVYYKKNKYRARLITQDMCMSTIELSRIAKNINLCDVKRVLEVGAGYGRMAWMILELFPHIEYTIVDIEPALSVAKWYLEKTVQAKVNFLTPEECRSRALPTQDICINTSSFDEMPAEESIAYLGLFDGVCKDIVYLCGYGERRHPDTRLGLSQFNYPKAWKKVYQGTHPSIGGFQERVYKVNV